MFLMRRPNVWGNDTMTGNQKTEQLSTACPFMAYAFKETNGTEQKTGISGTDIWFPSAPEFSEMAEGSGIERKGMYTVKELSIMTGIPIDTLYDEIHAGRLKAFLPGTNRRRGMRLKPKDIESWLNGEKET